MQCARCKMEIDDPGDCYDYYGQTLCEDCYVTALEPPKPCDPAAVSSATATRRQMGQQEAEGLMPLQQKIYQYIKEKGPVTRETLATALDIPPRELEKQFAVLRHCELTRAFKEGNQVFVTVWKKS